MRISDWSSDVCSSDLRVGLDRMPVLIFLRWCRNSGRSGGYGQEKQRHFSSPSDRKLRVDVMLYRVNDRWRLRGDQTVGFWIKPPEIGRATCVESVCHYGAS